MNRQYLEQFVKANGNSSLAGRLLGISEGHSRKVFAGMTVQCAKELLSSHEPQSSTVFVPITDVHWGEVIAPTDLNGHNEYNSKIAKDRMTILFGNISSFVNTSDSKIHFVMMGDHISGMLHEENRTEDEMSPTRACNEFSRCFASHVKNLMNQFPDTKIEIDGLTSNHARQTFRTRAKNALDYSYDLQLQENLDMMLSDYGAQVNDFADDLLLNFSGVTWALSHGHNGGTASVPGCVKGKGPQTLNSMNAQWASLGHTPDYCGIGHYHTYLRFENWFIFPAFCGASEYETNKLRLRPQKPRQIIMRFDNHEMVGEPQLIHLS